MISSNLTVVSLFGRCFEPQERQHIVLAAENGPISVQYVSTPKPINCSDFRWSRDHLPFSSFTGKSPSLLALLCQYNTIFHFIGMQSPSLLKVKQSHLRSPGRPRLLLFAMVTRTQDIPGTSTETCPNVISFGPFGLPLRPGST